jgi:hypothetical protein
MIIGLMAFPTWIKQTGVQMMSGLLPLSAGVSRKLRVPSSL